MNSWHQNREALRQHLKNDDLADFLHWSTIRATMYVGTGAAYIKDEYETLETEWPKWMPVVRWTGFGSDTFHVSGDGYVSDPSLIHQAYHLKQWLDKSKLDVSQLSAICEIGAGYGAMALICRRLGFEGRYYIVDFPELQQIQAYYLNQVTPYISMTHWIERPKSCDLLIACHSLSEIPINGRERLLSQVGVGGYLFASSYEFDGVDNKEWFKEFAENRPAYEWEFYPHPYQENTFYLVG